jgi:DNA recombination protein RmuC
VEATPFLLSIIAAILLGLALALFLVLRQRSAGDARQALRDLQIQMKGIQEQVASGLGNMQRSVDTQVNLLGNVQRGLGELSKATDAVQAVGKDISGLGDLLRPPKFRGQLGEFLLEQLLEQAIPKGRYRMQHTFADGKTVDAMIFLGDKAVPIDSKFPLDSFSRLLSSQDQEGAKRSRREFDRAVKGHIDAVAEYIRPREGTLEFGLMYIPAENVFYETVIRRTSGDFDLFSYAQSKRVIPVSPNTMYLYLQSVALGLTGLELQERVEEVWAALSTLEHGLRDVVDGEFSVLGRHLSNAQSKYDDTRRKLERFGRDLTATRRPSQAVGDQTHDDHQIIESLLSDDAPLFSYGEKD